MRALMIWGLLALVSACTGRGYTPTMPEALEVGSPYTVFAATSRAPDENGNFGSVRSEKLRLLELTVSIPPTHRPGTLEFGYASPDPARQFTMAGRREFASPAAFRAEIAHAVEHLPGDEQEVTLFVHGYNATQAETAFRAAQLANDVGLPGATVIYSWPSRARPLGYVYDNDSLLFARDGMEQLLRQIEAAGVRHILLVAHSLGAALAMETLRQIEIKNPGWTARALGGVILISPDLDVELFRTQMARLAEIPQPFIIFVSERDPALGISSRLRGGAGRKRLGNIRTIDAIADLPVEIIDTAAFARGGASPHFLPATSPALIAMLNQAQSMSDTFGSEEASLKDLLSGRVISRQAATEIELFAAGEGPR